MRKYSGQFGLGLLMFAGLIVSLSGCGQRVDQTPVQPQTQAQTETKARESEAITETETKKETETQKETETEPPRRVTDVDYTSKDGTIKITLPDNTWKIGQDADEMRVFQSGKDAMINIVHANTESSLQSLNVMTTQKDLEDSLTEQYADAQAFEVKSFVDAPVDDVHVYRYVVKYNSPARMWAYSVTNAIVAPEQAYVVIGSITEDNKNLLEAVQKSVASFRVLKDEKLKSVTGEVITGTIQNTSEAIRTDTVSGEELQSLKEYGTSASLVTVDQVNVRLSPGTDANVLITLDKSSPVTVTGETANWFQVSVNGTTGYIRKDFLVYATAAQANVQAETKASETTAETTDPNASSNAELGNATNYGSSATLYATSDVNVRALPGTDSDITGGLATGNSVTVVGETDNWFIVSVNGATGYVSKAYLSSDAPAAAVQTPASETTAAQDTAAAAAGTAGTAAGTDTTAEGTAAADTAAAGTAAAGTDTTAGTGTDTATAQSETAAASAQTNVSGTVIGTTPDSITVQGDDGKTYSVYYGDANMNSADGIYDGVYVSVNLDSTQASSDGTLYATDVTGY